MTQDIDINRQFGRQSLSPRIVTKLRFQIENLISQIKSQSSAEHKEPQITKFNIHFKKDNNKTN